MKSTKIQEAEIEPAELENIIPDEPLTYDQIVKDLDGAMQTLLDDPGHILALSLQDKKRLHKIFKRATPKPEFKADHQWLCDFIKEEIDEGGEVESVITEIKDGVVTVDTRRVTESNGRGAKKEISYDDVEKYAFELKTKTAVAQALGFYGAPGFNNRLNNDPAFKAAYEKGCARRAE